MAKMRGEVNTQQPDATSRHVLLREDLRRYASAPMNNWPKTKKSLMPDRENARGTARERDIDREREGQRERAVMWKERPKHR